MFEIAAQQRPPLATLLTIAAVALALTVAATLAWTRGRRALPEGRALGVAVVAGLLLTGASAVAHSSRDAGTGTHRAWGWPRAMYTHWSSWETPEENAGVRWAGIAENALVYTAAALLVAAMVRRPRAGMGSESSPASR